MARPSKLYKVSELPTFKVGDRIRVRKVDILLDPCIAVFHQTTFRGKTGVVTVANNHYSSIKDPTKGSCYMNSYVVKFDGGGSEFYYEQQSLRKVK